MTQTQLAEATGLRQHSLSYIERGHGISDRSKFLVAGALMETVENLFPYPPTVPTAEQVAS